MFRQANRRRTRSEKKTQAKRVRVKCLKRTHKVALAATEGLDEWIDEMFQEVQDIIDSHRESGKKYVDKDFDLTSEEGIHDCVLVDPETKREDHDLSSITWPDAGVRAQDLYPNFCIFRDSAHSGDVVQGELGTCFFLAALSIVGTSPGLLENLLVNFDKEVGIYAFRFFIDGEWELVIIDDFLPCVERSEDDEDKKKAPIFGDLDVALEDQKKKFADALWEQFVSKEEGALDEFYHNFEIGPADGFVDDILKKIRENPDQASHLICHFDATICASIDNDKDRRESSDALHDKYRLAYAKCRDRSEIWVSLMEKAYAKLYNGFQGVDGGFVDKALVDLTGGVALTTTDIPKTKWGDFVQYWKRGELFSVSLLTNQEEGEDGATKEEAEEDSEDHSKAMTEKAAGFGLFSGHAYSVLRCLVWRGKRLVLIRNPWGEGEWKGPWSDGSAEWTPEALKEIQHTPGDDGKFWMSWKSFKTVWHELERTRVFSREWSCATLTSNFTPDPTENDRFALVLQESCDVYIVVEKESTRGKERSPAQVFFRVVRVDDADWEMNGRPEIYDEASEYGEKCIYDGDTSDKCAAQTRLSLKGIPLTKGCYYILPGAVVHSDDGSPSFLADVTYQVRVFAKVKNAEKFWLQNPDEDDRLEESGEMDEEDFSEDDEKDDEYEYEEEEGSGEDDGDDHGGSSDGDW